MKFVLEVLRGMVIGLANIIPGVSGSMMLMLLGYYNPVVGSVSGLVDALLSGNMSAVLRCCGVLIPFGIGVVVGIFAVAKLIEILLRRFPGPTYCAIMGLVTASPVADGAKLYRADRCGCDLLRRHAGAGQRGRL